MAQVGRIGGHLLFPNLERNGVDLSFKNTVFDDEPVLYLQVDPQLNTTVSAADIETDKIYKIKTVGTTNFILIGSPNNNVGQIFRATGPVGGTGTVYELSDDTDPNPESGSGAKVGIHTENPVYDLDVSSDIITTNFTIGTQGYISNVTLNSSDTFSTVSGPLNLTPDQTDPLITAGQLISDNLKFNDNTISSFDNSNIVFDNNGTGRLVLSSNTTVNGNLSTTGNITLDGNLSAAENIIVGDSPLDLVNIQTDFTQTLEPATDVNFDIGAVNKRWANLWSDNWQNADNLTITGMIVSDQTRIDGTGTNGEIFTLQSNDNLNLQPNNGYSLGEYVTTINDPDPGDSRFGKSVATNSNYVAVSNWLGINDGTVQETITLEYGAANNADGSFSFALTDFVDGTIDTISSVSIDTVEIRGDFSSPSLEFLAIKGSTDASYQTYTGSGDNDDYYPVNGTGNWLGGNATDFLSGNDLNFDIIVPSNVNISPAGMPDGYYYQIKFTVTVNYQGTGQNGNVTVYNPVTNEEIYNIVNPTGSVSDLFGYSIDMNDDYLVIGAPSADVNPGDSAGKVYVYELATGTLSYTIDNPDPVASNNLDWGYAVGVSENNLIIGSPTPSNLQLNRVTYEFGRADSVDSFFNLNMVSLFGFTPTQVTIDQIRVRGDLSNSSIEYIDLSIGDTIDYHRYRGSGDNDDYYPANGNGDYLGSGPTITAGILPIRYIIPSGVNFSPSGMPSGYYWQVELTITGSTGPIDGKAVIYDLSTGTEIRTLTDPGTSNPDNRGFIYNNLYGQAVDVSDTYAIVGAPGTNNGSRENSGEVHVYNVSSGTRIRNIDNPFGNPTYHEDGRWGHSVATTDTHYAAGAPEQDFGGMVRLYEHSTNTTVISEQAFDRGLSVDISDTLFVVGDGNYTGQVRIYDVNTGDLLYEFENDYTDFDSGPSSFVYDNGHDVAISDNFIAISIHSTFTSPLENRVIVINAFDSSVFVEDLKFNNNDITNTLNTPLIFTSTGIGYLRFMGDNGFVIPAGDDASRPSSPEVGDTRWNTDGELLECFDAVTGTYITSIGPGDVVDQETMEELGNVYALILG